MSEKEKEKEKPFHFFVDGKKFDTDSSTLTGAQIKALANVPGPYQLFLEVPGDAADTAISDGQGVSLEGGSKHLYAVPPATFGAP